MQVICTDGTVFACEGYELSEYGVLLYGEDDDEDDRYNSDPDKIGFVPHDQLQYVLPEGVTPVSAGAGPGQQGERGAPPAPLDRQRITQGRHQAGQHPPAPQR